jgi:hypothetical protein
VTTDQGRREAKAASEVAAELALQVEIELGALGILCEYLKEKGLPGNEAARMRQYERFLSENFEKLRVVKRYRTRKYEAFWGIERSKLLGCLAESNLLLCLPQQPRGSDLLVDFSVFCFLLSMLHITQILRAI